MFGGQVIGQAVASAAKTTREDMRLHSLHCYFLLAGNRAMPIIYKVSRVRDGGSYCTRQVDAQQNGRCIFTIILSYQVPEPLQPTFAIPLPEGSGGNEASTSSAPPPPNPSSQVLPLSSTFTRSPTPNDLIANLPSPEESPLNEQRYVDMLRDKADKLPKRVRATLEAVIQDRLRSPVEIRNALPGMYDEDTSLPTEGYEQAFWLRTREPVGRGGSGDEAQKAALAYLSDFQFLSTIPKALGNSMRIKMMASLDHSMWFYADFDVHEWLLFVMQAQAASHGRGIALGRIYRRDGTLVAVLVSRCVPQEQQMIPFADASLYRYCCFLPLGSGRHGAREARLGQSVQDSKALKGHISSARFPSLLWAGCVT